MLNKKCYKCFEGNLQDTEHLYAGIVYDTLRELGLSDDEFIISSEIRPLDPMSACYGPAFTNVGHVVKPDDDYANLDKIRLEMYKIIQPGDIIVLQANDRTVAHAGDITCMIYDKLGTQGFITDGIVRDSRHIMNNNYPCFCSSTNPIDALDYWAITDYHVTITMPGLHRRITVEPGDMIYADNDAVIRISRTLKEEFERMLIKNLKREEQCRQAFIAIERSEDVYNRVLEVFNKLGRW